VSRGQLKSIARYANAHVKEDGGGCRRHLEVDMSFGLAASVGGLWGQQRALAELPIYFAVKADALRRAVLLESPVKMTVKS
jgi:hypothetical protein